MEEKKWNKDVMKENQSAKYNPKKERKKKGKKTDCLRS